MHNFGDYFEIDDYDNHVSMKINDHSYYQHRVIYISARPLSSHPRFVSIAWGNSGRVGGYEHATHCFYYSTKTRPHKKTHVRFK